MSEVRTRSDYLYFQTALTNYSVFRSQLSALEDFLGSEGLEELKSRVQSLDPDKEDTEEVQRELEKIQDNSFFSKLLALRVCGVTTVVFSAMCLESLVNEYGILNTSGNYFGRYLDRLDSTSKWVIVPKVVAGTSIDTDGQAFELISNLFTYRNKLVHPKSREVESMRELGKVAKNKGIESLEENSDLLEEILSLIVETPKSLKTIKQATEELFQIDPDFEYLSDYKLLWDEGAKSKAAQLTSLRRFILSVTNEDTAK